jgi:hypothetical protein
MVDCHPLGPKNYLQHYLSKCLGEANQIKEY